MMKERPILFSAPMVRALLAGTKTQTRRVLRDQNPIDLGASMHGAHLSKRPVFDKVENAVIGHRMAPVLCPYGKPGDRLWVRQAWRAEKRFDHLPPRDLPRDCVIGLEAGREQWPEPERFGKLRPSMFMLRRHSPITLEIDEVRVERLQNISQADAMAEGAPPSHPSIDKVSREFGYADFPRSWYAQLWDDINGPGAWADNPFVWIVKFHRIGA